MNQGGFPLLYGRTFGAIILPSAVNDFLGLLPALRGNLARVACLSTQSRKEPAASPFLTKNRDPFWAVLSIRSGTG